MDEGTEKSIGTVTRAPRRPVVALVVAAAAGAVCLCASDEPPDVAAAQEQFCADVEEYVSALDTYGGLFADVDLTVGEVREAGEALDPGREAVLGVGGSVSPGGGGRPHRGGDHRDHRPGDPGDGRGGGCRVRRCRRRHQRSHPRRRSGGVVHIRRLRPRGGLGAGLRRCGVHRRRGPAQASQWVSDYVSALQTDLQTLGLLQRIDRRHLRAADAGRRRGVPGGERAPGDRTARPGDPDGAADGARRPIVGADRRPPGDPHHPRLLPGADRRSVDAPARGGLEGVPDRSRGAGDRDGRHRHPAGVRGGAGGRGRAAGDHRRSAAGAGSDPVLRPRPPTPTTTRPTGGDHHATTAAGDDHHPRPGGRDPRRARRRRWVRRSCWRRSTPPGSPRG